MPPELATAITAVIGAAVMLLRAELVARAERLERERHRQALQDVQAKVGADRRSNDGHR